MNKIMLALKSRTFWVVVLMFLTGGIQAISNIIPDSLLPVVEGGLGLLAAYFHVTPSQNYTDKA
jgi:hypothetical protein